MWDLIVSVPDHCLSFYLGSSRYSAGEKNSPFYALVGETG